MRIRRAWPQLRVVRLRRNSGHQAALTAGLHRGPGEYVVSIDADLQDPPETIAEMLRAGPGGGPRRRLRRAHRPQHRHRFKRHTAGGYYWLMRRLVGREVPTQAGDFRLLSRAVVDVLQRLPEHQPVYRLLVPWLGFPSGEVRYVREERAAGETKYPLAR